MDRNQRSTIAVGVILILVGGLFLASQLIPGLNLDPGHSWPFIVIGVGVVLLLIGLFTGVPDMAVPACIVGGIGGILYYQNLTGDWASWSYAWALIPGFVGIGMLLARLLGGGPRYRIVEALETILTSAVLFAIFGYFLGPFKNMGAFAPLLLVAAGVILLGRAIIRPRMNKPQI